MNTAPRRSPRIAAKMVAAPVAPRRSARIAAKAAPVAPAPVAPAPVAPAPVAPAPTTSRRSPRFAGKPIVVYCADGSTYKRNPSHWSTNPHYKGLIQHACMKLDNDIKTVKEYLDMVEATKGPIAKADMFIVIYRYLYTNDLVLLRLPKFREVAMKKLEETSADQYTMSLIKPTQRRIIAAQYKLFTERYRTMPSHPLYIA